jgi:hypothetical protein
MKNSRLIRALAPFASLFLIGCGGGSGGGNTTNPQGSFECDRDCQLEYYDMVSHTRIEDIFKSYSPARSYLHSVAIMSESRYIPVSEAGKNSFLSRLNSRLSYSADGFTNCYLGESYRYYADLYELTKNAVSEYEVYNGYGCADIKDGQLVISANSFDGWFGGYTFALWGYISSLDEGIQGVKYKINVKSAFDFSDPAAIRLGHTFENRADATKSGLLGYSFTCAPDQWHCYQLLSGDHRLKYRVDWKAANDTFEWSLEALTIPFI